MPKRHPNEELNRLFMSRPYQGVPPEEATYLFVNLDANFPEEVEQDVFEYLKDPVNFWKTYDVHHPFLLRNGNCKGKKFHMNFAKIGLTREFADKVCFIELLDYPTLGGSPLSIDEVKSCREHLKRINQAIEGGKAKYVFIPLSVGLKMVKTSEFSWMPKRPVEYGKDSFLMKWARVADKEIICNYHFSADRPWQADKLYRQLDEIKTMLYFS